MHSTQYSLDALQDVSILLVLSPQQIRLGCSRPKVSPDCGANEVVWSGIQGSGEWSFTQGCVGEGAAFITITVYVIRSLTATALAAALAGFCGWNVWNVDRVYHTYVVI